MNVPELHEYREDCPGCQIALCDPQGNQLPDEHPVMVAAKSVWSVATLQEKQACHRVWQFNSRDVGDLKIAFDLSERIQKAVQASEQAALS